ncbi:unnamed protein product [Lupinus luteus]|uniref:Phytocyanin domain-containing protein n=1 Tax=Lupinus luteus TaxID=3873 RepID=A0AAV1XJB0_LUPLU
MGLKNTIFLLLVATLMVKEGLGDQHVVGGSQGWDQSTNFNSWTSGQTFKVGDQLVFKYSSMHSVVELGGESDYKTCNIGTPVNTMSSGNDVVKLDKPGTRYFTCATLGHCNQGMKVKIKVVKKNVPSSPAPSSLSSPSSSLFSPVSSPLSSSSSSSPISTSTSAPLQSFTTFVFIFALLFVASVI